MYGNMPDKRTDEQKQTVPYLPKHETYAQDRAAIVSLLFEETPISLYLNMTGGGETRESVVPSSLVSEPPRPMPAQAELTIGEEDGR